MASSRNPNNTIVWRSFFLATVLLITTSVWGATAPTAPFNDLSTEQQARGVLSYPGMRSPQETLFGFLEKTRQASKTIFALEVQSRQEGGLFHSEAHETERMDAVKMVGQAARMFDLSEVPEALRDRVATERTLMLYEIFKRIPMPAKESVPDRATTDKGDALLRWEIPDTEIAIEKSKNAQKPDYLFSSETLRRIPEFYRKVEHLPPSYAQASDEPNLYF